MAAMSYRRIGGRDWVFESRWTVDEVTLTRFVSGIQRGGVSGLLQGWEQSVHEGFLSFLISLRRRITRPSMTRLSQALPLLSRQIRRVVRTGMGGRKIVRVDDTSTFRLASARLARLYPI